MTRDDEAWMEATRRSRLLVWWWRWCVQPGGPGSGVDRGALWVYARLLALHRFAWLRRHEV